MVVGSSSAVVNEKSKRVCGIHFVGISVIIISIVGLFSLVTGRKSKMPNVWLWLLFTGAKSTGIQVFRCFCLQMVPESCWGCDCCL